MAARLVLAAASLVVILQAGPALLSAQDRTEETPAAAPSPARAVQPSMAYAPVTDAVATPAPTTSRQATPRLGAVQVRRELQIDRWLQPGEYVWNDDDAPANGPTTIVVNIRARVLSVYRDGVEIGRSHIVYGADNAPTPIGTFPILEKDADRWSRTYDAPMPHSLRLTADWVAIHGSDASGDDAASRGCVGLPREFAALLFDAVRVGDRVTIWDGVTAA
jgi:lipoprotein-anchoring transpeptidase ErfK/SrfK